VDAEIARAAHHDHIKEIDNAEADGEHPIDVEEDAGVGEHGDVIQPTVFAVGVKNGVGSG